MDARNKSRSLDHVNWWDPVHWKGKAPRSVSSMSLEEADPAEIRNGWLTLPETNNKVFLFIKLLSYYLFWNTLKTTINS